MNKKAWAVMLAGFLSLTWAGAGISQEDPGDLHRSHIAHKRLLQQKQQQLIIRMKADLEHLKASGCPVEQLQQWQQWQNLKFLEEMKKAALEKTPDIGR